MYEKIRITLSVLLLLLTLSSASAGIMDNWSVDQKVDYLRSNGEFKTDPDFKAWIYKEHSSPKERAVLDDVYKRMEAAEKLTTRFLNEKYPGSKFKITRTWGSCTELCISEVALQPAKSKGVMGALGSPRPKRLIVNSRPYANDIYIDSRESKTISQKRYQKLVGTYGFKASSRINPLPEISAKKTQTRKSSGIRTGIVSDIAITTGLTVASKLKDGESLSSGLKAAGSYLTTAEFLGGDLLCGTLGATLGAALPLPGLTAGTGLAAKFLSRLPVLGGAMLFARLGSTAISLAKNGEFSFRNIIESAELFNLSGQILGATLGATIGSFFPLPGISQIAGALIGGILAQKLMAKLQCSANSDGQANYKASRTALLITCSANPTTVKTTDPKSAHEYCSQLYREFLTAPKGTEKRLAFERYKEASAQLRSLVATY